MKNTRTIVMIVVMVFVIGCDTVESLQKSLDGIHSSVQSVSYSLNPPNRTSTLPVDKPISLIAGNTAEIVVDVAAIRSDITLLQSGQAKTNDHMNSIDDKITKSFNWVAGGSGMAMLAALGLWKGKDTYRYFRGTKEE